MAALRLVLLGIVLSALLVPSPAAPAPSATTTWAGVWSTGRGATSLAQSGEAVEGTYAGSRGHLVSLVTPLALGGACLRSL